MYRSRTYRRPLDRPPVLKTGRHTGDETFPKSCWMDRATIPTSQASVNRTFRNPYSQREHSILSFAPCFSYMEHRSDIVHEKMADVQFQCAVVAEKLPWHGPLFPRQNVFPKQRTQGRSRTSVRRFDDLVDFPSKTVPPISVRIPSDQRSGRIHAERIGIQFFDRRSQFPDIVYLTFRPFPLHFHTLPQYALKHDYTRYDTLRNKNMHTNLFVPLHRKIRLSIWLRFARPHPKPFRPFSTFFLRKNTAPLRRDFHQAP